jgi:hypothetical protein
MVVVRTPELRQFVGGARAESGPSARRIGADSEGRIGASQVWTGGAGGGGSGAATAGVWAARHHAQWDSSLSEPVPVWM